MPLFALFMVRTKFSFHIVFFNHFIEVDCFFAFETSSTSWQLLLPAQSTDQTSNVVIDTSLLYFNRVPKTGSMNMVSILRSLSEANGFIHKSCGLFGPKQLSRGEQV